MPEIRERLNLYLTKSVAEELRRVIPPRERTRFVEEALAKALRRQKLLDALEKSYGAWKDEDHPELATGEDIDRWIDEGRKTLTRDWSKEWGRDE
jgi:uncharacterized membrane-anchored protein YjiN (DUF445 family)